MTIDGNMFFRGGERWSPKGICYQPQDDADPLTDAGLAGIEALVADDGDWTKLGINAIRVYQVDPSASHDRVMALLDSRDIAVLVGCVLRSNSLPGGGNYPCRVRDRVRAVVDTFQAYDNVIGFSVSNELLTDRDHTPATAATAKALARDTKAYISKQGYRAVPVGLAIRDVPDYTFSAARYYACGPESDRVDFVAYNVYRWCGGDLEGKIGAYYKLYDFFKEFPVPVTLGEYGCMPRDAQQQPFPRAWEQVPYLFGAKEVHPQGERSPTARMSDAISGGFVFRYLRNVRGPDGQPRTDEHGLVDSPNGSRTPLGGFDALAAQYAGVAAFAGTPGTGATMSCDADFDPAMPHSCGAAPPSGPTTRITLTNEVDPATKIALAATVQGTTKPVATMDAGQPEVAVDVPQNATELIVIYDVGKPDWPMACRVTDMSQIVEGATLHGDWVAPAGQGACVVDPPG